MSTICFIMIVRDAAETIHKCLESIKNLADRYIICDTGSVDGTPEMITEFMQENNIPGELIHKEWINYGANRDYLHEYVFKNDDSTYHLWIDSDEYLLHYDTNLPATREQADELRKKLDAPNSLEELETNMFLIPTYMNNTVYCRYHITRNNQQYNWECPVHEELIPSQPSNSAIIDELYIPIVQVAGAKPKERYFQDIEVLSKYLAEHPGHAHSTFYLAQSYRDVRKFREAIEYYQEYANLPNFEYVDRRYCRNEDFVYVSYVQIGRMEEALGNPDEALEAFRNAHATLPHRIEAPYDYVLLLFRQKKLKEAFQYICEYKPPEFLQMGPLIEPEIWNWMFSWLAANIALGLPGDYELEKRLSVLRNAEKREAMPKHLKMQITHRIKLLEMKQNMQKIWNESLGPLMENFGPELVRERMDELGGAEFEKVKKMNSLPPRSNN